MIHWFIALGLWVVLLARLFSSLRERRLRRRLDELRTNVKLRTSIGLVPAARCGVPLVGGGFCMEPASPDCCYCDLHANWKGGA